MAGNGEAGMVRGGPARNGRQGRHDVDWQGKERLGGAGKERPGQAGTGADWHGSAGEARSG